ncbi:MAG: minor capsid protein [Alkaliphilus sp.]
MKHREYWRQRFVLQHQTLLNIGHAQYQEMQEQYRIAISIIEGDLSKWYSRFANNNDISIAEAKQWLSAAELKEFKWDVNQYIKHGKKNALNPLWMKELENASARVHISRLDAIKIQLKQQVEFLYEKQRLTVDKTARTIYTEGFYRTAYEVQKGLGVGSTFATLDTNKINKVISKPWAPDGSNFSSRVWVNKDKLVNALHTEMTQMIIRGDAPDKAIKIVAERFNVSKRAAGRLIMTESAAFASTAQEDAFNALDVEKFEIVATLDMDTSEKCKKLDGKVADMKDYEVGVTANPFHAWCRTTTVPWFSDFNEGEMRFARDNIDGTTYKVPTDMKYEDWYQKHIIDKHGADKVNIFTKKAKNFSADKVQHKKYKTIFKDERFNSFEKFQELKYNRPKGWEIVKSQKQKVLNSRSFSEIKGLEHGLGSLEVRSWYKAKINGISDMIDKTETLKQQAMKSYELRNKFKTQARDLMVDQEARKILDIDYPIMSFDELIEDKMGTKNISREKAIKDIIKTSTKTNKKVDKSFGLEW